MDQYPFDCFYCGTCQLLDMMDYDYVLNLHLCYACGAPIDFVAHGFGSAQPANAGDGGNAAQTPNPAAPDLYRYMALCQQGES